MWCWAMKESAHRNWSTCDRRRHSFWLFRCNLSLCVLPICCHFFSMPVECESCCAFFFVCLLGMAQVQIGGNKAQWWTPYVLLTLHNHVHASCCSILWITHSVVRLCVFDFGWIELVSQWICIRFNASVFISIGFGIWLRCVHLLPRLFYCYIRFCWVARTWTESQSHRIAITVETTFEMHHVFAWAC